MQGDTVLGCIHSLDWTSTGLDYWTDLFYYGKNQFSSVD